MGKAQKFCAYRDRCISEVESKLLSWGLPQKDVDELIDDLVENDFINESRYIVSFTRGKFNNNRWGRHKIRMALKEKRLKEEDINMALEKLDEKEYEKMARHLVERKWTELSDNEERVRSSKTYYYMVSKGFEPQVFIPFLKQCSK